MKAIFFISETATCTSNSGDSEGVELENFDQYAYNIYMYISLCTYVLNLNLMNTQS